MSFTKYDTRGAYHWAEFARRSPFRYSARLHALYEWFVTEANARRPSVIVDVGCGDAALTHLLGQTGARVVGIEPEARGVDVALEALQRAGSSAEVIQGVGEDLPFGDGDVSLVVMCELVEHLPAADALFAEAARVLARQTGTLLVSTPQWQRPELREFHVHEYRATELEKLLTRFFGEVVVLVSEPPEVYDRYLHNPFWRLAINTQSVLGRNPFADSRPCGRLPRRVAPASGNRLGPSRPCSLMRVARRSFGEQQSPRPVAFLARLDDLDRIEPSVSQRGHDVVEEEPFRVGLHAGEHVVATVLGVSPIPIGPPVHHVLVRGALGPGVVRVEHHASSDPFPELEEMAYGICEVVEDADVVAEIRPHEVRAIRAFDVEDKDSRALVVQRGADDRLRNVLDASIDCGDTRGKSTQRNRVDALEAADLQHVLAGEVEALVKVLNSRIRDELRIPALSAPRHAADRPSVAVQREATPRQQAIQSVDISISQPVDEETRCPVGIAP